MKSYAERRVYRHSGQNRFMLGALILVVGILLILKNLGLLPESASEVVFSWQMLLIALGLLSFARGHNWFSGLVLVAVGSFFLLREYTNSPEILTKYFWGGLLILLGVLIILRAMRFGRYESWQRTGEESNDYVEEVAILGGGEKRITSKSFKGGRITCIFGGSNLDFTDAKLADGNSVLDVVSIFGGFKLVVPPDWNIRVETTSIMGGISDKRVKFTDDGSTGKVLHVKGVAIFGGGEIKNYA